MNIKKDCTAIFSDLQKFVKKKTKLKIMFQAALYS
jgi:hypothetical protein